MTSSPETELIDDPQLQSIAVAHDRRPCRSQHLRQMTTPRRALRREEAAVYMGISPTKFDQGVAKGLLPPGKTGGIWGSRKVWDVHALDLAFDALPEEGDCGNPWD